MKKLFLFYFLLFSVLQVVAQKEANVWYFGDFAGIDFNSGTPVALTNGVLTTGEGCATICNKNGVLLFYTNGINVWDRTHALMPNGFGMLGSPSSAQSAIIVPKPGNSNGYYIFTTDAGENHGINGFRYSEVDMTLNGGLGDVLPANKNTLLFAPSVEKITAVRHANGLFTWVIAHGSGNNRYSAYLVGCNGVSAPVVSNVGQVDDFPGWGYLTSSPDGKHLASAMCNIGFELLDFDNATGIVSNPALIGTAGTCYGVSFSPNSNLLYGSRIQSGGTIYQWNLQAGSATAITSSIITVGIAKGTGSPYLGGALQIGPDKKIYITQFRQPYLSVINNPDVLGTGCNLQFNAVDLMGRVSILGLPCLMPPNFDTPVAINYANVCLGAQTSFSINRNGSYIDSMQWNFGDPVSGANNAGSGVTPTHTFSAAGVFSVRLIKYTSCVSDTVFTNVTIKPLPVVNLGNDIAICATSVVLKPLATYAAPAYLWSNGVIHDTITVTQSGTYWLQVTDSGCTNRDTVNVDLQSKLVVDLGNDRAICNTDALTLSVAEPAGTQYTWSTGLTADHIDVTQSGTYWLQVERNGCLGSDTVNVTIVQAPVIDAGPDTTICEATPIQIGAFVSNATYQWNNDSTTPYIYVSATGDYILKVKYGPCVVADTVSITAIPNPVVNLGADTDICPKEIVALNAGNEGVKYIWSDGTTNITDTVVDTGTYWVIVTSEYHCVGGDTVHFRPYPLPILHLPGDTTVCEETPFILKPLYVIHEDTLRWSEGGVASEIDITKSGKYIATAINKCGSVKDTVNIHEIFCDIKIPNAFTPDGDGLNDILKVLGNIERLQDFQLSVYDRWGELLFMTHDKYAGWNGTQKGRPCATDTFVYVLQYSLDGQPVLQKGNVTLIR